MVVEGQRVPSAGTVPNFSNTVSSLHYFMFGLLIRSDVRLPLAPVETGADERIADLIFKRMEPGATRPEPEGNLLREVRCDCTDHAGGVACWVYRGTEGMQLWIDSIGMFHISPDSRSVTVYPQDGADDYTLGLVLSSQVSIMILQQLGYPSLHASAVVIGDRAVGFLGPKGQGKSTMIASFLHRGSTLLTDDILPVKLGHDAVCGMPSLPIMKLWGRSVEGSLQLLDEFPNLMRNIDKKLLTLNGRYRFAETPVPLRALYVLQRYDSRAGESDIEFRTLSQREALAYLLAQTSQGTFMPPARAAGVLPLYARLVEQAPVRVLHYPNGFEHQQAVYDRILADVKETK